MSSVKTLEKISSTIKKIFEKSPDRVVNWREFLPSPSILPVLRAHGLVLPANSDGKSFFLSSKGRELI